MKEICLELYRIYRSEMLQSFDLHRQAFRQYLTLVIAILGAALAGFSQLESNNWLGVLVFIGLSLEIYVCRLAKKMCNRAYVGSLERIALSIKLEEILGIKYISEIVNTEEKRLAAFKNDKNLLPQRWIDAGSSFETTQDFVEQNLKSGVNKQMIDTFTAIQFVSVAILILLVGTMTYLIFSK